MLGMHHLVRHEYRRKVSLRLPAKRQSAVSCGPYTLAQWGPSRRVPATPGPMGTRTAQAGHFIIRVKPGTSLAATVPRTQ
jgi:hypothetical protein